jgi:retron-type reverse transcriptase
MLTISISQVNAKSEQYWKDYATFWGYDRSKRDFLYPSLMENFSNEVNHFLTKDVSSFQEVNNKF